MFAIIRTGGKQYKVQANDKITVEKLSATQGATVSLDHVLMIGDGSKTTVGTPRIEGARVQAVVEEQGRAKKIIVFKKKRRHNYRRKKGHRQDQTVLRIVEVLAPGATAKKTTAAPKPKTESKESSVAKTAATKATATKAPAKAPAKTSAPTKATTKAPAKKAAPTKKSETTTAKKPAAKKPAAKASPAKKK